jgi:glutamate-1-semialdehyde aminotransferase
VSTGRSTRSPISSAPNERQSQRRLERARRPALSGGREQSGPKNFAEAKVSDTRAFARFFHSMLDAGVVLPPSQFEAWFVSAAHDDRVIEETLEAAGSR